LLPEGATQAPVIAQRMARQNAADGAFAQAVGRTQNTRYQTNWWSYPRIPLEISTVQKAITEASFRKEDGVDRL
jgi:hypothetical protein